MGPESAQPWQVVMALASLEFGYGNDSSMAAYRAHLKRHPRERITALVVVMRVCRVEVDTAAIALGISNIPNARRDLSERPPDEDEVIQFSRLVGAIFRKAKSIHLRSKFRQAAK